MTDPIRDDEAIRLAVRAGCAAINGHEGIDTVCEYPGCDCSGAIATKAIISAYEAARARAEPQPSQGAMEIARALFRDTIAFSGSGHRDLAVTRVAAALERYRREALEAAAQICETDGSPTAISLAGFIRASES